jgi:two-component system probable response regulator PhcQ
MSRKPPKRPTVLLVDDELHVLAGLRRMLHKAPYTILCASAADEAFVYLRGHTVDVVITDQDMPGMCGTLFLATVCREFPETVRFMLTGQPTLDVAIEALNAGAIQRFFTKPCHYQDLALALREAIQHRDVLVTARRLGGQGESAALAQLERTYPGITTVRRDRHGIIVADQNESPVEALVAQLRGDTGHAVARLGKTAAPREGEGAKHDR